MSVTTIEGLTGANRDAAAALTNLFRQYGLESLAPRIVSYIQSGLGADAIQLELQNTTEYKTRFAGNEKRRAAGLPVLSPAEYVATEQAYRQVMSSAGLPVGFYDQPEDFHSFLANDVSPTEVKQRVDAASQAIFNAPTGTLDIFRQYYNEGDLIAYALDPAKAAPLIEQRIKAAEAGATAAQQGLQVKQSTAEDLARQGFSLSQLQSGFGDVAANDAAAKNLGNIYGENVTTDDLVAATFGSSSSAAEKVKKLASQERATFGGTAGATSASLGKSSGGQL